jgi:hypothetical protein
MFSPRFGQKMFGTYVTLDQREPTVVAMSLGASKPASGRRFKTSQLGSCLVM